jgi:phage I-like protein
MITLILNRDFQHPKDGWYMIEPKGEHPNPAAKVVQIIDELAADAIVENFNRQAEDKDFPGMLIDHEHFAYSDGQESRAFGWLNRLDNRPDGIYAQIRWTATGRAAVDGGDYRFFSTVYAPSEGEFLNSIGPRQFRPLALAGLTLTNKPNNKGGKPITNRADRGHSVRLDPDADQSGQNVRAPKNLATDASAAAAAKPTTTKNKDMKNIATKLGLAAEAGEEAILAEVTKIMNRATESEAALKPANEKVIALTTENQTLRAARIEADLDIYKNRFAPEQRESFKALLVTNREHTLKVLQALPAPGGTTTASGMVCNRDVARTPADGVAARNTERAAAVEDYRLKNRCTFTEAWAAVQREKPELFKN